MSVTIESLGIDCCEKLFLALLCLAATSQLRADPPAGWGGGGEGYKLALDKSVKHAGQASGTIKAPAPGPDSFGSLTQGFKATDYQGKRVRMSAFVKSENVEGWSGLWMRVDGKDKTGVAFDNMMGRPIKGTNDWAKFEIVLDVPGDAEEIYFGILLAGKGQVWVDDFKFETVGQDVKSTGLEVQAGDRQGDLNANLPKEPKNLDFEQ